MWAVPAQMWAVAAQMWAVPAQMWAAPAQMCLKADAPALQRNMREGGTARLCAHGSDLAPAQ